MKVTGQLIGGLGYTDIIGAWVRERLPNELSNLGGMNSIAVVRGSRIIVGVVYNHYVWPNICVAIAAEPGSFWASRQFLFHAFAYPYLQLGCNRITATIASRNTASRRLAEGLGFKQEGELRNSLPDDNEVIYGLLKEECRWIGVPNETHQRVGRALALAS